jgi:hypothetical protein
MNLFVLVVTVEEIVQQDTPGGARLVHIFRVMKISLNRVIGYLVLVVSSDRG